MSCHPALVSQQSTGGRSAQEAATLAGGVTRGHVHGGRSHLGLPTKKASLSDLLTKLEDVSHTTATMVTMGAPPLLVMVPVVASLLLLPSRQTGHSTQQTRGQTSSSRLVAGVSLLSLLLALVLCLVVRTRILLRGWRGVTLGRVGTCRTWRIRWSSARVRKL